MSTDSRHLRDTEASTYFSLINKEVMLARVISHPTPLTWLILVANVLLFVGAWLHGEFVLNQGFGLETWALSVGQLSFYTGMKLNPHILDQQQWWRLFSSAFVHMDITHILFNGYGLYSIGPIVERFYGKSRWLVIYLGAAVLSATASMVFSDTPSGGASGALYGLVGALLVLGYKYRADLPARISRAFTRGMLPWVVFGIGIGFFDFLPMDNAAHIGGLLTGMACAMVMQSQLVRLNKPDAPITIAHRMVQVLAGVLTVAALGSMVLWGVEVEQCTDSRDAYLTCYPEITREVTMPYGAYIEQATP